MSPEYVRPYVKAHKNDDRDAEAIAEAATRPTMRLVTLKSESQLDLQVLHRARERLVTARTRLTNQLRAVLLERGVILPKRRAPLQHRLHELMAGELLISPRVMRLLQELRAEWASLDERIRAYDDGLARIDAATALDGRQDQAPWDQQAGQQIPENPADPRRPCRLGALCQNIHWDRRMATATADPGSPQRRGRGTRRQAGTHRVGGAAARACL